MPRPPLAEALLVEAGVTAPQCVKDRLGTHGYGIPGQPADGVRVGDFDMFEAVACGADPLLPHLGRGLVKGLEGRIEACVADDVEARLDAEQRTRRQVRRSLRNREVLVSALPGGVAVIRPQGSGPGPD